MSRKTDNQTASLYPPIADYAVIGNCHTAALISRSASIDWCCLPRFDSDSVFGRLLDWSQGGYCEIRPQGDDWQATREYLAGSLVLVTTFKTHDAEIRVTDLFPMREGGRHRPYHQLLRIVEGVRGAMSVDARVAPRFDFGVIKPWIRSHSQNIFTAVGGNSGMVITGDLPLQQKNKYELIASFNVVAGERLHLSLEFIAPERLDDGPETLPGGDELDRRLQETLDWWRSWTERIRAGHAEGTGLMRSAIVLKALTYAPTGAIVAAPTTSLPAGLDGDRAWDYRFSWVRDAAFTVDALVALGVEPEARHFRDFVQRSAAGSAQQLQTLYGIDGRRRQEEFTLDRLAGYQGRWPVRVGNQATHQLQLDIFGELIDLSWRWHQLGHAPEDDYWRFIVDIVDTVADGWEQPDHGIWEMRGAPQHFVHSKVMCWTTLHRGIGLAEATGRTAPVERWTEVRDRIAERVLAHGYDDARGVFVQAFGTHYLDAALLLLPRVGFIEYNDARMVRTVDAIRHDLDDGGLLKRYNSPDNLQGEEAAFLACSFWLVECLARQDRRAEAEELFARTCSTANDVGLFSEQFDIRAHALLGNFPQGLTHLSHIAASLALTQ